MLIRYTKKNTGGYLSKKGKTIRKPDKTKKGIMVAVPVGESTVRIGWALCNFSMGDKFNDLGIKIAVERAETASAVPAAQSMIDGLIKFIDRAKLYYKDKKVEVTFSLEKEHNKLLKKRVETSSEDILALEA